MAEEKEVKNFALLIRQVDFDDGQTELQVRAQNEGIPDAEVILTVEAWLERVSERVKKQRMGNLVFDDDER